MNMQTKSILLGLSSLLIAAVAAAWSPIAHAAPATQPLDLMDVLTMRRFGWHAPLALSADGRQVAYVVSRPTDEVVPDGVLYTATGAPYMYHANDIWLTGIPGGESRDLTGGQGTSWAAAWSPDGGTLAFCSDRDGTAGLWLWSRDTDTLRRLGDFAVRAQRLEWSPDGTKILIGVLPEGAPLLVGASSGNDLLARLQSGRSDDGPTVQVFHSEYSVSGGVGTQNLGIDQNASDLALVDVVSGRIDRIARGVALVRAVFSPDGRHVAFSETTGDNVPGTHVRYYTLKGYSLDQRRLTTLVPPAEIGRWSKDFSWSPDSRLLAYRLGRDSGDVHLVSPAGESRPAAIGKHPPFRGMPAWDDSGDRLLLLSDDAVWSVAVADGGARELARIPGKKAQMLVPTTHQGDRPWLRDDGRTVVLVASDGLRKELYSVSLERGGAELLFVDEKDYTGLTQYNMLASPATGQIVYAAEDAQHPEDLWITDPGLNAATRLTQLNPGITAVPMGTLRIIEWTGDDGLPYSGALLLPSDYRSGKRYPLVTYVYPMDVLLDANKFGSTHQANEHFNLQLFATRGYAVLYAGATLRPTDREPMRSVANAVLPGVDKVIELGIADPARIGVFGASAGGYSTLALIVQSTRFKVAMAQCGPGNLLSLYGDLRDSGYSHGLAVNEATFAMPDHPWKERDRYIRNSPWFFLDRVETPLLLIHGTDDTAAIVNQSNEVFLGLRRLGKTAQYARYGGEGHGLTSLHNRVDAGQRFLDWFERYLQPNR